MKFRYLLILILPLAQLLIAAEPIKPIPLSIQVDRPLAHFGKRLFFDKRLSKDGTIACVSCHKLNETAYGTDLSAVSKGVNGRQGLRNSPTVYNSVFNFKQFWDGRADTLAHQAIEPVVNSVEMAMKNWDEAIDSIDDDPYYQSLVNSLFDGKFTAKNIQLAIAEFEKTLISPNSPFDQFLRGDNDAISQQQKRGYALFKSYGCIACHQGVNVGGNLFQKIGVMKDINLHKNINKDLGRFSVTGNEWDKHVFKVPSLRLAVKTPPYFHDGSVATIEEAVDIMIKFQLGRQVPEKDRAAIISFLNSLVGTIPKVNP